MALTVSGLTVHYGTVAAVSDVDLAVADGEVLALLGPSGCGKSTLLRAVAGLEPASGRVCWDDVDLAGVPVHRRGFGLVFQDGQLFPHRDVVGNVEFGLRMRGEPRTDRVAELLELVGLTGYERRRVHELSGGEQQRVALARALAPRPRLLLLDEPLSALDRALREQLAMDLARVLETTGSTALVVTHDHDEAFTLADRVAVMRAGRIIQVGEPAEVWRRPVDEDTARFLGCGEVLSATVAGGVARCALGEVRLPWAADGRARLGLRPTALRPADEGVPGEVVHRVHRRDHVRLRVRVDGRLVDAVAGMGDAPPVGAEVRLAMDEDGVALLPA
ncbi:ABC transporter ATP-binding protein [Actinophytocola gossypii]|uniref:ABC transporter ATP-binding protein n=1 Tax=Actinophytocola gossypii TaxID=2812003 RepID=A0ABT2JIX7_9PSEU|nr:ABC transporter ATP-binding protein [Actinophytocola gossypii]MCT2587479.1 ABC transporter ATP-binding protein [Actinophytocola gossypii]